jgi:hypothetical protein
VGIEEMAKDNRTVGKLAQSQANAGTVRINETGVFIVGIVPAVETKVGYRNRT